MPTPLIAWTLRTRPALSWTTNLAFPARALSAIAAAAVFAFTPLRGWIDLAPLPASATSILTATVLAAVAVAIALRILLHLDRRL